MKESGEKHQDGSTNAMGKIVNKEQLHKDLIKKLNKEHAFWSYDKASVVHITDDILIEKVLLHLDIDDIKILFKLYPKIKIQIYLRIIL